MDGTASTQKSNALTVSMITSAIIIMITDHGIALNLSHENRKGVEL